MKKAEEEFELHLHPRPTEMVSVEMPADALASLRKVAASRDMSYQALIKLYIGQGLRQDLSRLFAERVLQTTEQVLAKHVPSEEVSAIIREIQVKAAV